MTPATRPCLAPKVRLRHDSKTDRYLLLYPEKGLQLNPTAAAIVRLCNGERTVAEIVAAVAEQYTSQPREVLEREVHTFLAALSERALLRTEP